MFLFVVVYLTIWYRLCTILHCVILALIYKNHTYVHSIKNRFYVVYYFFLVEISVFFMLLLVLFFCIWLLLLPFRHRENEYSFLYVWWTPKKRSLEKEKKGSEGVREKINNIKAWQWTVLFILIPLYGSFSYFFFFI